MRAYTTVSHVSGQLMQITMAHRHRHVHDNVVRTRVQQLLNSVN